MIRRARQELACGALFLAGLALMAASPLAGRMLKRR